MDTFTFTLALGEKMKNNKLSRQFDGQEQTINEYRHNIQNLKRNIDELTEKFKFQRAAYNAAKRVISDFEGFHPYSLFLNSTSRKFPNGVPETVKTGVMANYLRKNLETERVKDIDKWMNDFYNSIKIECGRTNK